MISLLQDFFVIFELKGFWVSLLQDFFVILELKGFWGLGWAVMPMREIGER